MTEGGSSPLPVRSFSWMLKQVQHDEGGGVRTSSTSPRPYPRIVILNLFQDPVRRLPGGHPAGFLSLRAETGEAAVPVQNKGCPQGLPSRSYPYHLRTA